MTEFPSPCTGTAPGWDACLGPASHRRVAGLHLLRLRGTPRQMGRQHGALLREAIPDGPLLYYRRFVAKMLAVNGLGPLAPAAARAIELGVGRRVARALPDEAKEAIRGLSEGCGIPYRRLLQGAVMPDSLMWVATRSMRLRGLGPATAHRLALGLGCSSAIAWGEATADGALLHGRNFDYHGVEAWPRAATVAFCQPDEGLRYVAVTAAGIPLGGITAMNEAGLTLAVHQHMFSDQTTLGGTPVGVVGDRVMRRARTLEQAEALLRAQRPIGCWTYLIASAAEARVLCHEETPHRAAVRLSAPEQRTLAYANIFFDPELGRSERNLYPSYWRNNCGRQQQVDRLLAAQRGALTPGRMAALLAHPGDPRCRLRRAIAMLLTTASVVFRPDDGALWVATGEVPVSQNPFEPFSLATMDHAPALGRLEDGAPDDPDEARAFGCYRDAYIAYFERRDLARARALVEEAAALQPHQPLYQVLCGLLALKSGDPGRAEAALERALALGHPDPQRIATFLLWRGRARDLLGRREAGLADYRGVLGRQADPAVRRAAARGLSRPFSTRAARRLDLEFAYADVITP